MTAHNHSDVQAGHPASRLHRPRHQGGHTRPRADRARFRLDGLSSSFEAERLERRLERQVGVIGAMVNPVTSCAYVAYDPALTSPSLLARQIEVSGFQITNR
jgi:hypothetical protein